MRKHILLLLTISLAVPAYAVDSAGNFAIWGAGKKSCHKYNLARAADDYNNYKDYVMGYLTAYNHQAPNTYNISGEMTLDDIIQWLDDECQLKPVISFEEALTGFILEHHETRMMSQPGGFGR